MKKFLGLMSLSFLLTLGVSSAQAETDLWCESDLIKEINDEETGYLSFFTPEQREFFAEMECGYKISTLARDPNQAIEDVVVVFTFNPEKACLLDDGIADGSTDKPYLMVPCEEGDLD